MLVDERESSPFWRRLHRDEASLAFFFPAPKATHAPFARSPLFMLRPAFALSLLFAACNGVPPAQTPPKPGPRAELLQAAATCAQTQYSNSLQALKTLQAKASDYAANRSEATLAAARAAWHDAMGQWQRAEVFRLGPMARTGDPGAQDLRDEIYAWPLVSRCKIEEQLIARIDETPNFATSLINARTLTAAEYLLFYEGTDNACGARSSINANGSWDALDADALSERKARYLVAVVDDVVAQAEKLVNAWSPSGGNFEKEFAMAGQSSRTYRTEMQALNALSHALFYMEIEVKDYKLGRPIGIQLCPDLECPFESPYARRSTQNVVDNLGAAHDIFLGCQGNDRRIAFDDWLVAAGAEELATRMTATLARAEQAAQALDAPLNEELQSNEGRVKALYDALKSFTDLLKTEFVSVLNLELPRTAEGDND